MVVWFFFFFFSFSFLFWSSAGLIFRLLRLRDPLHDLWQGTRHCWGPAHEKDHPGNWGIIPRHQEETPCDEPQGGRCHFDLQFSCSRRGLISWCASLRPPHIIDWSDSAGGVHRGHWQPCAVVQDRHGSHECWPQGSAAHFAGQCPPAGQRRATGDRQYLPVCEQGLKVPPWEGREAPREVQGLPQGLQWCPHNEQKVLFLFIFVYFLFVDLCSSFSPFSRTLKLGEARPESLSRGSRRRVWGRED